MIELALLQKCDNLHLHPDCINSELQTVPRLSGSTCSAPLWEYPTRSTLSATQRVPVPRLSGYTCSTVSAALVLTVPSATQGIPVPRSLTLREHLFHATLGVPVPRSLSLRLPVPRSLLLWEYLEYLFHASQAVPVTQSLLLREYLFHTLCHSESTRSTLSATLEYLFYGSQGLPVVRSLLLMDYLFHLFATLGAPFHFQGGVPVLRSLPLREYLSTPLREHLFHGTLSVAESVQQPLSEWQRAWNGSSLSGKSMERFFPKQQRSYSLRGRERVPITLRIAETVEQVLSERQRACTDYSQNSRDSGTDLEQVLKVAKSVKQILLEIESGNVILTVADSVERLIPETGTLKVKEGVDWVLPERRGPVTPRLAESMEQRAWNQYFLKDVRQVLSERVADGYSLKRRERRTGTLKVEEGVERVLTMWQKAWNRYSLSSRHRGTGTPTVAISVEQVLPERRRTGASRVANSVKQVLLKWQRAWNGFSHRSRERGTGTSSVAISVEQVLPEIRGTGAPRVANSVEQYFLIGRERGTGTLRKAGTCSTVSATQYLFYALCLSGGYRSTLSTTQGVPDPRLSVSICSTLSSTFGVTVPRSLPLMDYLFHALCHFKVLVPRSLPLREYLIHAFCFSGSACSTPPVPPFLLLSEYPFQAPCHSECICSTLLPLREYLFHALCYSGSTRSTPSSTLRVPVLRSLRLREYLFHACHGVPVPRSLPLREYLFHALCLSGSTCSTLSATQRVPIPRSLSLWAYLFYALCHSGSTCSTLSVTLGVPVSRSLPL
ncbi:hypothetical protein J6590_047574 [Homalodisca vitripennis]|nr:hypothetical protein J6590_047574 [Homalodisca vitripennis]